MPGWWDGEDGRIEGRGGWEGRSESSEEGKVVGVGRGLMQTAAGGQ